MKKDSNQIRFQIELSDFLFITRNMRNGKGLRLTVTWKLEHPEYGLIGQSASGWLVTRTARNELRVTPPMSRFRPGGRAKAMADITQDFHDLIVKMLEDKGFAKHIGNDIPEELRPKLPDQIDPSLPNIITAETKEEDEDDESDD